MKNEVRRLENFALMSPDFAASLFVKLDLLMRAHLFNECVFLIYITAWKKVFSTIYLTYPSPIFLKSSYFSISRFLLIRMKTKRFKMNSYPY